MSQSDLKHFFHLVSKDPSLQDKIADLAQKEGLQVTEDEVAIFAARIGQDKTVDHKKGLPPNKLS